MRSLAPLVGKRIVCTRCGTKQELLWMDPLTFGEAMLESLERRNVVYEAFKLTRRQ